MDSLSSLFSRLIFTSFVYLLVPIIIIVSKRKFTKKKLKKIMIFNGVGGFLLFSVLYILVGIYETAKFEPAFIWSYIGFAILKQTSCLDNVNCLENDSEPSEIGGTVAGTDIDLQKTEKNTLIYVVGKDVPTGKHMFIATNDSGGKVRIFSSNNALLDILYVKKKEKIKLKPGNIVKATNCIIANEGFDSPVGLKYTPTESPSVSSEIKFCRKCGEKLIEDSQFCRKCGAKTVPNNTKEEKKQESTKINPIEKLALLTVSLPSFIAENSEEEPIFIKNIYTHCEAIIFVEFFIRANALEIAPSQDKAIKFSDEYINIVINSTIELLPEAKPFFADMFYSRATLYDDIVINSKEPIIDVVEILTHIIHKEIDEETYIKTNDKNFRHFGGLFENLAIKTELVGLFKCINDCTTDAMKELKEHFKTL